MSEYGRMIGDTNLQNIVIYNFFVYYFDNPRMKKIKSINGQSLYACGIPSMLVRERKYVIAVVNDNQSNVYGDTVTLDQLQWYSLQTRTIDEEYDVPFHNYRQKNDNVSISKINVVRKTDKVYEYKSDQFETLSVQLIFSKNQTRSFSDSGTLKIATETFNTLFSFI
jgi:hypothetical protein